MIRTLFSFLCLSLFIGGGSLPQAWANPECLGETGANLEALSEARPKRGRRRTKRHNKVPRQAIPVPNRYKTVQEVYESGKYSKGFLERIMDIAQHVNGHEKKSIFIKFFNELEAYHAKKRPPLPNEAPVPRDWHRDAWEYTYAKHFDQMIELLPYYIGKGIKNLYILPPYKSPMRDGGYDVSDHYVIRPELGGNPAFARFMAEAKKAGIRIVMDFVPSHLSNQHPWFQRAIQGNKEIDYFIRPPENLYLIEKYRKDGQWHVKYTSRDGKTGHDVVSERFLEFPDVKKATRKEDSLERIVRYRDDKGQWHQEYWRDGKVLEKHKIKEKEAFYGTHYSHYEVNGRSEYFYSTFYPEQMDLNLQNPEVIQLQLNTMGYWLHKGVQGIRADAPTFWIKYPGSTGMKMPETHSLLELFHAYTKMAEPTSGFIPEVVLDHATGVNYLGRPVMFNGLQTGSQADLIFNFQQAMLIKDAMINGNFHDYGQFMLSRRQLPPGTNEILPIHTHDELALGFIPDWRRSGFQGHVHNSGGLNYKGGFSAGGRLYDLLGQSPHRMKALYKFFYGHRGTVSSYYGDELGARNNWQLAWKLAFERIQNDARPNSGKITPAKHVIEHMNKMQENPESMKHPPNEQTPQEILPYIDARDIHRGDIPMQNYKNAQAGHNPVYNGIKPLANARKRSKALRDGGYEEGLNTLRDDIGSFMRRYREPSTGVMLEEVAVIANPKEHPTTVTLNRWDLTSKLQFKLVEVETGKEVPYRFIDGGVQVEIGGYETLWLRVENASF